MARVDGAIGDPNAKKYFYHTDHLGSIKAVTDTAGKVVYQADYHAFGSQFAKEGNFDEVHGFNGKEFDADTGLYYYNARWYDPELGRFVSEDPAADPNNPNLYVYCGNNPLGFIDPTGTVKLGDIGLANPGGINWDPNRDNGGGTLKQSDFRSSSGGTTGGESVTLPKPPKPSEIPNPNKPNGLPEEAIGVKIKNGKIVEYKVPGAGGDSITYRFNQDGSIKSITTYCYNGKNDRTESTITYKKYGLSFLQKEQKKSFFGGWVTTKAQGYTDISVDNNGFSFIFHEEFSFYTDSNGVYRWEQVRNWNISIKNNDFGQIFAEYLNKCKTQTEKVFQTIADRVLAIGSLFKDIGISDLMDSGDFVTNDGAGYIMRGDKYLFSEKQVGQGMFIVDFFYNWNHSRLKDNGSRRIIDSGNIGPLTNNDVVTLTWLNRAFGKYLK